MKTKTRKPFKWAPVPRLRRPTTAYKLLQMIERLILQEPRRYDQGTWLERFTSAPTKRDAFVDREFGSSVTSTKRIPDCGTIGCVAGWVTTLVDPESDMYSAAFDAKKILGLTSAQSVELFDGNLVAGNPGTLVHARNGVKHIRDFRQRYKAHLQSVRVAPSEVP